MKNLIKIFMLVCFMVSVQGCTHDNSRVPESIDSSVQSVPTVSITETISLSLTSTIRNPTDEETKDAMLLRIPTQVPEGKFVLLDYMPLILDYDTSLWVDKSEYSNSEKRVNYLQSKTMSSCILGPSGPSGFFPSPPDRIVELNGIRFEVVEVYTEKNKVITHYFANFKIDGNVPENSISVLDVISDTSELTECVLLAEGVLSTLHVP